MASQVTTVGPTEQTQPEETAGLPEELQKALKDLWEQYDVEDRDAYWRVAREAQLLEFYWRGIQDVIWDPISRDWMSSEGILQSSRSKDEIDVSVMEKNINVYRANGESFVAALATSIPYVRFAPDDADDADDISTAKAYGVASELIQKHNNAPYLFFYALYTAWNGHFVAAYNYHGSDESFGTRQVPQYGLRPSVQTTMLCPQCGADMENAQPVNDFEGQPPEMPPEMMDQESQMMPPSPEMPDQGMGMMGEEQIPPEMLPQEGETEAPQMAMCPNCGQAVESVPFEEEIDVPYIEKYDTEFKTREIIEVYGPRHVRIPMYAKTLRGCPYLVLATEHHVSQMLELFPDYADKISPPSPKTGDYVRQTRVNVYQTTTNQNVSTLQRIWFRPWAFNYLRNTELRDKLRAQYPKGALVYFVDDVYVGSEESIMDDHWTFAADPLTEYIYGMPKGQVMKPIQDIINDVENLSLETILHGIPETFADTDVLAFDKYADIESAPGQTIPAHAKDGQTLSAGFHTIKATTLGREITEYRQQQDTNGQFVTGILPSIYGGPLGPGQSRTLGVYQKSQSQALQRLSITWKMLNWWWAEVLLKSTKSFCEHLKEDEKLTKRVGNTYMNLWIRKSELEGTVGACEPEQSDQFPVSWEQIRGMLLELIGQNNPIVMQALMDPQNAGMVARTLGFKDLKIPGDDDREKQLEEIAAMLQGQQLPTEPGIDNDAVHIATCTYYLNSEQGRILKRVQPDLYGIIAQHLQMHQMYVQQQQELAAEAAAAQGGPSEQPPDEGRPDQGASEAPPQASEGQ